MQDFYFRKGPKDKINLWTSGPLKMVNETISRLDNLGITHYGVGFHDGLDYWYFFKIPSKHDRNLLTISYPGHIVIHKQTTTLTARKEIEMYMSLEESEYTNWGELEK